jgi:hypothetical protein
MLFRSTKLDLGQEEQSRPTRLIHPIFADS